MDAKVGHLSAGIRGAGCGGRELNPVSGCIAAPRDVGNLDSVGLEIHVGGASKARPGEGQVEAEVGTVGRALVHFDSHQINAGDEVRGRNTMGGEGVFGGPGQGGRCERLKVYRPGRQVLPNDFGSIEVNNCAVIGQELEFEIQEPGWVGHTEGVPKVGGDRVVGPCGRGC